MKLMNFGQNVQIESKAYFAPRTELEVIEILNQHKGRSIRCIGRLHSWSQVLDTPDVLLDLRHLNTVEVNGGDSMLVDVGSGCQVKRLLAELARQRQWTLPSVGFITEQTIAGAVSTGTHGSGRHSLSHYVSAMRVARYDQRSGEAVIVDITDGDELCAARCSLGCLGVILSVTMQCRDMYCIEEHFREYTELTDVLRAEEQYPLQQFYLVPWNWTFIAQHRRETDASNSLLLLLYHYYRFLVFDLSMHMLIVLCVRGLRVNAAVRVLFRWILPAFVIRNWRVIGPSSTQLVMEHELFRHVEIELFVQRPQLTDAMLYLQKALVISGSADEVFDEVLQTQLIDSGSAKRLESIRGKYVHHYPVCVRRILPDDTLISMASGVSATSPKKGETSDDTWYSITLTNYHRGQNRAPFENLAEFLAISMARLFCARPHWGKLSPLKASDVVQLYPGFERFKHFCDTVDPERYFGNPWTRQLLQSVGSSRIGEAIHTVQ